MRSADAWLCQCLLPCSHLRPRGQGGRAQPLEIREEEAWRLVSGLGSLRWCELKMDGGHNATSHRMSPKGTGGARPGPSVRPGRMVALDQTTSKIPSGNLRVPRGHTTSPESRILENCLGCGLLATPGRGLKKLRHAMGPRHEGAGEAGGDHDANQIPVREKQAVPRRRPPSCSPSSCRPVPGSCAGPPPPAHKEELWVQMEQRPTRGAPVPLPVLMAPCGGSRKPGTHPGATLTVRGTI